MCVCFCLSMLRVRSTCVNYSYHSYFCYKRNIICNQWEYQRSEFVCSLLLFCCANEINLYLSEKEEDRIYHRRQIRDNRLRTDSFLFLSEESIERRLSSAVRMRVSRIDDLDCTRDRSHLRISHSICECRILLFAFVTKPRLSGTTINGRPEWVSS